MERTGTQIVLQKDQVMVAPKPGFRGKGGVYRQANRRAERPSDDAPQALLSG